jgi:hypothetical protein
MVGFPWEAYQKQRFVSQWSKLWRKTKDIVGEPISTRYSRACCVGVSRLLYFNNGICEAQLSALGGSSTVPHEPRLSTPYENSQSIFSRIAHEFGTHHDP